MPIYVKVSDKPMDDSFRIDDTWRESILKILTNVEIESDYLLGKTYSKGWSKYYGKIIGKDNN